MQAIKGLIVEISAYQSSVVYGKLPDVSAEMNQAIERSGGIEGGSK